jgi:hypothetical protein
LRLSAFTCVATLLSGGALALTANVSAFASPLPPSVASAVRVYAVENTTMNFTGTDPISGDDRSISVSDTTEGTHCDDSTANNYSSDDCPQVRLSLSTTDAGLSNIPNLETKNDSPDGLDHVVAPSGAVITNSSNGVDPSQLFDFNGTETQLNDTLATLQFIPATDYQENRLAASDSTLPDLNVEVVDGADAASDTADTAIKVEGTNQAPGIILHDSPLSATAGQQADFVDDADATDPEMCTAAICGAPYTNTTPIADPDASMLLVAWLDASCGTFNFGGAEFTSNGSASNNDVDSLLLNATIDDNANNGYNSDQRTAIENSIDPAANALDLTQETGSASQDTTVFAGIGDLENVDYALSHIEYTAPAAPKTCHLNVTVSDLGNDGTPTSFNDTSNPNYEVPDAKGASAQVTFDVLDTHPHVTVEQAPAGASPDPGVDPTHTAANYVITFDQPVDDFDPSTALDTSESSPGMGVTCEASPVTPNLVWDAACSATSDGTIKVTVPAGVAHASDHDGDSTYANNASTSNDDSITWDTTDPTVTIDPDTDDGQTNPATTPPIKYTVNFSEPIDGTFTGDDVDLSQSTAPGTLVAAVSGPNLPLHPNQYTVSVTGMTTAGDVIATVPAGSVTDEALNPNDASTSTSNDNDIQWQPTSQHAPTVASIKPAAGPPSGGTAITITGTGFVAGARVEIGQGQGAGPSAIAATNVTVVSSTKITAITGGAAKPGTWNLFVVTAGGASAIHAPFDDFTYAAVPSVSSVAAATGPRSGGTAITITGTGFVAGARVEIGQGQGVGPSAIAATNVTVVSSTKITAITGGAAKPGTWNLYVLTPGGISRANAPHDNFRYA